VDSTRLLLRIQLMSQLDSLQHLFLESRPSPEVQRALESKLSDVISRLSQVDHQAMALHLQIDTERTFLGAKQSQRAIEGAFNLSHQALEAQLKFMALLPRGWIGITPIGPSWKALDEGGLRVRYFRYPSIESVDPDSPADHAGVARGDVLLAFDGTDVTANDLPMSKLLQPDRRLTMRVRRNGADRDFTMTVVAAPENFLRRQNDFMFKADPSAGMVQWFGPGSAPRSGAAGAKRIRVPAPPGEVPAFSGPPELFRKMFLFDPDNAPVAGARMSSVNEDLGRALGVSGGVLVLAPAPGSIAAQAGLRGGDVIVKAGGTPVASVRDLRRLMENAEESRSLDLRVMRDKKARPIVLKW
jgi:membrane-associated protease RseP (regulator of RpoE activity)